MKIGITEDVPCSWGFPTLEEIVEVNPKLDKTQFEDDLDVSFVPMPAVEAESGEIDVSELRKFSDVKKGYTAFQENDVLFAKITPCTENGKMAVVPSVKNGVGFGSTEFHVLRSYSGISPQYVYYYVSSKLFRIEAEHNMTGAVGQRRVPAPWLSAVEIPLPPSNEQHRIVAKIEELFSELDKGIESLKRAREQLKIYRQALLKHAFEGKLTEQWRKDNTDKSETADQLLDRIKRERETRYQQQLEEWKTSVKQWEAGGKEGNKPRKPSAFKDLPPISATELNVLPVLPETWTYHRLAEISQIGSGMSVSKNRKLDSPLEVPYLRVANVQRGSLVLDEVRTMLIEEAKLKEHLLKKWDVLFNEGGDRDKLGRGWVWESQVEKCITQNHVFRASTYLGGEAHAKFVSHWGNTHGRNYFEKGGKQTTNLASINKTVLSMFPVPVPPVDEQEQIIDVLEEKMSTLDSFESDIDNTLQMSEALRQSILKKAFSGQLVVQDSNDEPASVLLERIAKEKHEAIARAKKTRPVKKQKSNTPTARILPFKTRIKGINTTDLHAGVLAIAYQHYEDSEKASRYFRHVKGEKIAHLVEAHLGIDLGRKPVKDAAGPNDYPHLMNKVEPRARKAGYFNVKKEEYGHKIYPLAKFDELLNKSKKALGDRLNEIEALLDLMKPLNTRQSEIVATLYAAWNNLLLDGLQPDDEAIVYEARENWHTKKLNIERDDFFRRLQWMKEKGLVPAGKGEKVLSKQGGSA